MLSFENNNKLSDHFVYATFFRKLPVDITSHLRRNILSSDYITARTNTEVTFYRAACHFLSHPDFGFHLFWFNPAPPSTHIPEKL